MESARTDAQQFPHSAVSKQGRVIDRAGASEHPGDQRGGLEARVRTEA
jgi:hypothetical protein